VRLRARSQDGFGLIELLMSMTILNIGILALVAAFQSGAFALQRASKLSTAAAIADIQMERYRGYKYCGILFTTSDVTSAQGDSTYTADVAYTNAQLTPSIDPLCSSATPPSDSKPIQTITGPDGKRYRVDTYIIMDSVNAGRPLKRVTVVIRNANSLSARPFARIASTFDEATGS
jgi:type II secretory pathway pseudopilin PulG